LEKREISPVAFSVFSGATENSEKGSGKKGDFSCCFLRVLRSHGKFGEGLWKKGRFLLLLSPCSPEPRKTRRRALEKREISLVAFSVFSVFSVVRSVDLDLDLDLSTLRARP